MRKWQRSVSTTNFLHALQSKQLCESKYPIPQNKMADNHFVSLPCPSRITGRKLIQVPSEPTYIVAAYRVSTKRQMENESISRQRDEVHKYCKQKNYIIEKEFELAETGYVAEKRINFEIVLNYCTRNSKKVKALVIFKIDRFCRGGLAEYYGLKAFLAKSGVSVESATEPIDGSAVGELMEGNLASYARFENRIRMDRTHGAEARLTMKGFWCRPAPTGFENRKVQMYDEEAGKMLRRPILVPTEDKHQWELLIWGLRRQVSGHYTIAEVVRQLVTKGFVSRTGKIITASTWLKICRSPVYGGLLCEKWTGGEYVRAKFDGPIRPDEWLELQQVLNGGKKNPVKLPRKKLRDEFPLRQFLCCPKCGNKVTGGRSRGKMGKHYFYYGCANRVCKFSVRAEKANELFRLLLKELKPTKESLELFKVAVTEKWMEKYKRLASETTETQKKVLNLRERKTNLLRLMEQSSENTELIADLKEQYSKVSKELTLETFERCEREVEEYDAETILNRCTHFMENADKLWAKATVEEKFLMQKLIFPNGIRFDDLEHNQTPEISVVYAALKNVQIPEDPLVAPRRIELLFPG